MTEQEKQEKQELIEHIKSVIAQYESDSYKFPLSEKVYRIALASLTAPPVKLPHVQVDNPLDGFFYKSDEVIAAVRVAGYEVQE